MALTAGTRFGPYEIIAAIGSGGMGEVYRARDTRLDRDVAIKVLPTGVSDDRDRRARFEREAKAVAALSHPNILAIHDIGESPVDGAGERRSVLYAVTELLDGETLRDKLKHGALPVRKAIETGIQIARGLAAAHDRGIVHRDLKPENVFALPDGQIKILDFGLAKASATSSAVAAEATATAVPGTDPGTVMGTVGYMAPEQIRGQAMDARSDLFAFGAVLYEMLSGQRAFRRDTAAETMTAILREDPPDLTATRGDLPAALDRIVRHCLEKNPGERFQTARDVAFALEAFSGTAITSSKVAAIPPRRRALTPLLIGGALLAVGTAAGYGAAALRRPVPARAELSFETRTWDRQWVSNARFGPDGQTIVYSAAATGNVPSLFVLRAGGVVPQPLGSPATHLLSVSRSGELAVLTSAQFVNHRIFHGKLTRMTLDGASREVGEDVREADWAPDGENMAIIRDLGGSDRLEFPVNKKLHEAKGYLSDLRVSPDGSRVAFLEHPARYDDRGWLKVVDNNGVVKTLGGEFWGAEGVAWSADGRTVFVASASKVSFGYLPYRVNADGEPVMESLFPTFGSAELMDVAKDGRVLLNEAESRVSMRALLPGESKEREFAFRDLALPVGLSRDGQWLLYTDQSPQSGLNYGVGWWKTDSPAPVRLGEGAGIAISPDARWALAVVPSPAPSRYVVYPTGAGQPIPLDFGSIRDISSLQFWKDGRLFLCGSDAGKPRRCYLRDLKNGAPVPVTPENVDRASPSPDGRLISLLTTDGQRQLLDVASNTMTPAPVRDADDEVVSWSQDGRAVFVRRGKSIPARIERVDVATGRHVAVRELMPPDSSGIIWIAVSHVLDENAYVYGYWRQTSKVVVVSGLN